MACWHVTKRPARPEEFVVADAGAPGRAEPPVVMGHMTSPPRSGLVKSAMGRAETWLVSEAPTLPKRLRVPGGAEVNLVLPWTRTGRDLWSWRRTLSLAMAWPVLSASWSCGPSGSMPALRSSVGVWALVEPSPALVGSVQEAVLLADQVSSAQAWQ